jgi:hypothetical protein
MVFDAERVFYFRRLLVDLIRGYGRSLSDDEWRIKVDDAKEKLAGAIYVCKIQARKG